jgi:integrase
LIATAARRTEVATMRWSDLDFERRIWTIPRELNKADRTHEIPLCDLALETIANLPCINADLVFPSRRPASDGPATGFSKAKTRLDRISGVSNWRYHDLRRTAASGMARLGHPPHVVGAVLNHAPGATHGITAVYVRHRYEVEKRHALEAWGREVERIIGRGEAKVIPIR